MKQFLLKMVMLFCVAIMSINANGSVTIDGLTYKLFSGTNTARLEGYESLGHELRIPQIIVYEGQEYTVTSIFLRGFFNCTGLTKVIIPSTIKDIKEPSGVDPEAYRNPFQGCINLQCIEVDKTNQWMCSVDGILFNKDKTKLYAYPAGREQTSYSIPESVTWIGGGAFGYCSHLKSVQMPNTVKILYGAFSYCKNLEEVNISENVSLIAARTFMGCSSLKFVIIPSKVWAMEEAVFMDCTSLECVVIKAVMNDVRGDTFSFMPQPSCVLYVPFSEIKKYSFYQGTVLPLEAYDPTAIHNLLANTTVNHTWYDLSGRHLSTPPVRGGVYIRDGRKVMIK